MSRSKGVGFFKPFYNTYDTYITCYIDLEISHFGVDDDDKTNHGNHFNFCTQATMRALLWLEHCQQFFELNSISITTKYCKNVTDTNEVQEVLCTIKTMRHLIRRSIIEKSCPQTHTQLFNAANLHTERMQY